MNFFPVNDKDGPICFKKIMTTWCFTNINWRLIHSHKMALRSRWYHMHFPLFSLILLGLKSYPPPQSRLFGFGFFPWLGGLLRTMAGELSVFNWTVTWWRHQMETFSSVNSPRKGRWRRALMIFAWLNGWVNNREAGDLRRHRAHYDIKVMEPNKRVCVHTSLGRENLLPVVLFGQLFNMINIPMKVVSSSKRMIDGHSPRTPYDQLASLHRKSHSWKRSM